MPHDLALLQRYASVSFFPQNFYRSLAQAGAEGTDVVAAAHLLSYLLRTAADDEWMQQNHFWFECPMADLMTHFHISEYVQRRLLKVLQKADLLEYERRGMPATRWARINVQRLHQMTQNNKAT